MKNELQSLNIVRPLQWKVALSNVAVLHGKAQHTQARSLCKIVMPKANHSRFHCNGFLG